MSGQPRSQKRPARRNYGGPVHSKRKVSSYGHGLESKLEPKLHDARIVHRRVHRAKPKGSNIVNRRTELGVVEEIEELRPEIQAHAFPRQRELFDHGEVGVDETRTRDRDAIRVPQFPEEHTVNLDNRRRNKAGRVDPLVPAVVGRVRVATSNPVWPVKIVPVAAVLEEDSRLVKAVDQGDRKTRGDFFDERQLPVTKKRVGCAIQIMAELLAPAEGQIVNDATAEAVIKVDLRQTPIEVLPIGEWEIGRT